MGTRLVCTNSMQQYRYPEKIKKLVRNFEEEIVFNGFTAVGYIPYDKAMIRNGVDGARPARNLFRHIENQLTVSDNKWVVFFRDTTNFGTNDFAIFFKDMWSVVGAWEDVETGW